MIRATVLGCGSSGGIPRLGNRWGDCDPSNPRNRRRRCSLLIQRISEAGTTTALIDTGPDLVPQLLDADVGALDAVVYTHPHADHIHGIDDLRQIAYNMDRRIPAFADTPTTAALLERFGYIFKTPPGSFYPAIAELQLIAGKFTINGSGGPIDFSPFTVQHGSIPSLGFRISGGSGALVYLPDVSAIPDEAWPDIRDAEVFICDALRRKPHPSHAHLAQALDWIAASGARRGVLTNMHLDMDYAQVQAETPSHIDAAFDGMVIEIK